MPLWYAVLSWVVLRILVINTYIRTYLVLIGNQLFSIGKDVQ